MLRDLFEFNFEATSNTSPNNLMKLKGFSKIDLKIFYSDISFSCKSMNAKIFKAVSSVINGIKRHFWA